MLVEADDDVFLDLIADRAPAPLSLAQPGWESTEILLMLRERARMVRRVFAPAAWLIVEHGAVAGMCSVMSFSDGGVMEIGYGVAPACRGRGVCSRAVADLVRLGGQDPRIAVIVAETSIGNPASQNVLERNGFSRTGERVSPEDGPVVGWKLETGSEVK